MGLKGSPETGPENIKNCHLIILVDLLMVIGCNWYQKFGPDNFQSMM
jgi:hypothetical protein